MNAHPSTQAAGPAVLIVDDDEATQDVLARLLSRKGYTPLTASDGPQCRAVLAQAQPDLILLDLFLPGEDGFSLLRELRQSPSTRDVPVIIHTLMDRCDYREKALTLGATVYLPKPLDLREVLDQVARLVPPAA